MKIFVFLTVIVLLGLASFAFAQITLPNPLNTSSIKDLLTNIANGIAGIIGSLAVIVFIWAGILFLTSAGNEQRLGQAKKATLYAVIGLAIALAGTALIDFIKTIFS